MKAFKATFTVNGKGPESKLIGAGSWSSAAKKAEEFEEATPDVELVSLETTDDVIL